MNIIKKKNVKKKKTTKKKTAGKVKKLTRKQLIILGAVALALAVSVMCSFFVVFGSYNGLGAPKDIGKNIYNMSAIYDENGLMHYEDENYTSEEGIDVSTFQGEIDWDKVKASGIDFVIIRLGYRGSGSGEIGLDDKFKKNLSGAKAAGLKVGVYFFSQAINVDEAIEEARFVIRHIRGKGVDYPVYFDMEPIDSTDRIAKLTKAERTEIADAFCTIIKRNFHDTGIYGNPSWLSKSIDLKYLTKYDFWLAQYYEYTSYEYPFEMWQYSNTGNIDGIKGDVDLNLRLIEK